MNDLEKYMPQARSILEELNSGPSGLIAYMWANCAELQTITHNGVTYSYQKPYIAPTSNTPLVPYYALLKTNRTGVEVTVPAGGTQDIMFEFNNQTYYAELKKPQNQIDLLEKLLNMKADEMNDTLFVAALLSHPNISNVALEPELSAAKRETEEEHGWSYDQNSDKASLRFELNEPIFSKRSYATNPPTPINQKLFVVETQDFENCPPVRTDKVESKIPYRMGTHFYEQGDYMSLEDLKSHLDTVQEHFNTLSTPLEEDEINLKVAITRYEIMERVQRRILAL